MAYRCCCSQYTIHQYINMCTPRRAVIAALMEAEPSFVTFGPQNPLDDEDEEEEESAEGALFGLGNLFSS
jgi:hypothetical protein